MHYTFFFWKVSKQQHLRPNSINKMSLFTKKVITINKKLVKLLILLRRIGKFYASERFLFVKIKGCD